jgi:probable F420-dependent oxidoreductase
MRPIKFDACLPQDADFPFASAFAQRAETLGFHSVSITDHMFFIGGNYVARSPHLECYTTLAALAMVTSRIRLMQAVTAMSFRNPALLAKMTSTLDHISGGRLTVGVGAGWYKKEYDAYGFPYLSNAERIEQLAEGIKVLKSMWTEEEPTYHGRFFSIEKAYNFPRPMQLPHPPLLVGGGGRKVLQIAATEADILNIIPPSISGTGAEVFPVDIAALVPKVTTFREQLKAAGRPLESVELSGFSNVAIAHDKSTADEMVSFIQKGSGMANLETVRRSAFFLVGTSDEARRQIRSRIEDLGISYFVLVFSSLESMELFANRVMPEFMS